MNEATYARALALLSLWVVTSAAPAGAGPLVVVDGGRAQATIVLPAKSDALAKRTAADLQQTFEKMTGVAVPICTDAKPVEGNRLLVGSTRWSDAVVSADERAALGKEGFVLRRRGVDLVLAGGGPYGVAYAASELLERLGARWYLPGPLGEVIPKLEQIRFDRLDVREVPSFSMRWVGKDIAWNLRNRTNWINDASLPPAFRVLPGIYHTQSRLIPHDKYGRTHPNFFALIKGKRSRDKGCKLCNVNPDLPAEIARRMDEILRDRPGTQLISLSPTDGQMWCECPACRALDEKDVPKDARYSRRQMVLYNRVAAELAKSHPDQLMLVGAYNVYTWPPKDPQIKGHRNLAVIICHYEDYCLAHPVNDSTCRPNQRYLELIRAWQRHTPHVYFYEYYDKANWLDLPWPIVHTVAADIPFFKQIGIEGLYTQYTTANIWSNFLVHYVAARLLWDHTTDVPALLEEFYAKFYGRAAGPMKAYHEALEKKVAGSRRHFPGNAPRYAAGVFDEALLARLRGHLDQARALAKDERVLARIERLSLSTEYAGRLAGVFRLHDQAKTARDDQKVAMLRKALGQALALREDVLGHGQKYAGVASGRYFPKRRRFGRWIETLRKDLARSGRAGR